MGMAAKNTSVMPKDPINQFSRFCFDTPYDNLTNSDFPDDSVADARNYCRSPNGARPWCMYMVDGDISCDNCSISICPG